MNTETDLIMQNKVFAWIALATAGLLMVPYLAMQFNWQVYDPGSGMERINWTLFDFIAMGTLIFGVSTVFVLVVRVIPRNNRIPAVILSGILFLWLWVESAVGLFTNWGN